MTNSEDSPSSFDDEEMEQISNCIERDATKDKTRFSLVYEDQHGQFRCTTTRENVMGNIVDHSETSVTGVGGKTDNGTYLAIPDDSLPEGTVHLVEAMVPPEVVPEIVP